jgi:hypothetical protein
MKLAKDEAEADQIKKSMQADGHEVVLVCADGVIAVCKNQAEAYRFISLLE